MRARTPRREGFSVWALLLLALAPVATAVLCVCVGSVAVALPDTLRSVLCILLLRLFSKSQVIIHGVLYHSLQIVPPGIKELTFSGIRPLYLY